MQDRRIFIYLSFGIIVMLIVLSGILIFFERGGTAEFDLLGQQFSSSNIGLAVLFLAGLVFVYVLREFSGPSEGSQSGKQIFTASDEGNKITWNQVIDGVSDLTLQLTAASGFRPDLVIGICGGGLVVADIVSKRLGYIPCLAIWPNRHTSKNGSSFGGQALTINQLPLDEIISTNSVQRILIIDDVVYGGSTMQEAVNFITEISNAVNEGNVEVRTATLFSLTSSKFKPDFSVYTHSNAKKMMPVSDRLRGK